MSRTYRLAHETTIPRLGFGAMRICGTGIWGLPERVEDAVALLREVVHQGVRLIDTADAYGPEVSECLIAQALRPYPEDLVIATKGGIVRGGPSVWDTDGRPEHLTRAIENSLRRLQLERIDLYQLHAVDEDVPIEASLGALVRAQEQGKIRSIGVSNVTVAQLERARSVCEVATVQNRFNLRDRTHEPVLRRCAELGIGFMPWDPLATGDLARHTVLPELTRKYDATPSQIALAWLLAQADVVLPIPGTSSIDHLRENVLAQTIELDPMDVELLSRPPEA